MDATTTQKLIRRTKDDITRTLAYVGEHQDEQEPAYWQGYLQATLRSILSEIEGSEA